MGVGPAEAIIGGGNGLIADVFSGFAGLGGCGLSMLKKVFLDAYL